MTTQDKITLAMSSFSIYDFIDRLSIMREVNLGNFKLSINREEKTIRSVAPRKRATFATY